MDASTIPDRQYAVQLVGPDELRLNKSKEVFRPGPHQILGRVEATGLCFSDLKLLKQFTGHVRKSAVVSGVHKDVLDQIPSYVPGDAPTVPGHETVVRIVATGEGVKNAVMGGRYLVQTDWRWARTERSNGAFGYNFEGGLQEYVLMDERVMTSPEGDSMLIPVSDDISASAIALVEPWACVEDSYCSEERRCLKKGGKLLVLCSEGSEETGVKELIRDFGQPGSVDRKTSNDIDSLGHGAYDDIVYFGNDPSEAEKLFPKLAANGLFNIVQCGGKFGRDLIVPVGRIHYGGIRIIGTVGSDPGESMNSIPETGEIRDGDSVDVVGAGGPMGMMHVIRNVSHGVSGVTVHAGDLSAERLDALAEMGGPIAEKNGMLLETYNPAEGKPRDSFSYVVIMVPAAKLVGDSMRYLAEKAIINIFAGIPIDVTGELDLDTYISRKAYFIGTSGSTLRDMYIVLDKVTHRRLNTNLSVAAVCGLDGAVDGIRATENRTIAGKIIVYPSCRGLGLVSLEKMADVRKDVAAAMPDGIWTDDAEAALVGEELI